MLVALVVGAPLVLLAWVGNPWPAGGWSEVQLLTNRSILGALAVVGWLAWAQMAACILIELAGAVGGKAPQRVRFASGGQQQFARVLVTSVIALGIGGGIGASIVAPSLAATTAATPQPETAPTTSHTVERRDVGQVAPGPTVTIDRDTTVWKLAEVYLDDGSRWRELLDLNRGEALSDGTVLTQATQTVPTGSTLRLSADAHVNDAPTSQRDQKDHRDRQDGIYTVNPNDTLWDIAEAKLDDPARYMELYEASTGTLQPGGDHLVDPDHIEVGWKITIPGGGTAHDGGDRDHGNRGGQDEHGDRGDDGSGEQTPETPDVVPEDQDDQGDQGQQGGEADATEEQNPSAETAAGDQSVDEAVDEAGDESVLDAGWVLPGLTGGGVLLAGALYLGLQRRRRAQFRARRPGRAVAAPPAELAPTGMTISAAGGPVAATVAFMDVALRRLAEHARTHQAEMPPLAAVQLREDLVTLHLSGAVDLPAPWEGSPDRLHWSCSTAAVVEDLGPDHGWAEAPYPMLVTIGVDDRRDAAAVPPVGDSDDRSEHQGGLWLLNCEELGTLEVVGDPIRAGDFARHLAVQLAVNPWSQQVSVDCVGIAQEAEGLGDRIRYYDAGWEGDRAASEVLAEAVSMVDRAIRHDTDVSTGRTGGLDDDVWPARMLVVTAEGNTDSGALHELRRLIATHVGRTGTAIVVTATSPAARASGGDQNASSGTGQTVTTVVEVTSTGRVLLGDQGLDLAAVELTREEAHGCALLYAHSEILDDVAVPVDEEATEGWQALVDQTGALRRELTLARSTPVEDLDEPATSLLAGTDEEYVTAAPVVPEDLEVIAPKVPESVLAKVKAEDPALDADLADWFDPHCPRPKLTLLGPVAVRTHGRPLAKYKALGTEIVAYLALRPRNGATRDELAEAVGWDDPARVRKYIDLVRHWLGEDPETHEHYLPHANKSPAAKSRGVNVYQVTGGLLIDWDLFRRLRARGAHSDLLQALELVTGRPFDHLRQGGWSWLYQGDPHDQYAAHAIADVAFTVVTHCLRGGDLVRARAATEIAILAVPDEQIVQLCQVALTEAEGNNTEAMRILLGDVCNRAEDGEAPLDLPERTQEIIRNHQWIAS
ncbi:LysM peptidoglycan-binding domain-containing protein [Nocardioides aquaticus]|uniref:LysM peptidoglycan-binding domain-containing protein n=1 Tax=Nocardioides aquaticus TaxID=160826 RepID=UPI001BD2CB45|nr:LysM peptidoglycan-binding domain-containing protein [Nocardioides aquaticus]